MNKLRQLMERKKARMIAQASPKVTEVLEEEVVKEVKEVKATLEPKKKKKKKGFFSK